jgi:hypothetical protein
MAVRCRLLHASVHGSRPSLFASPFACSISEADGQPALIVFANPASAGDGQVQVFVGGIAPEQRRIFAHGQPPFPVRCRLLHASVRGSRPSPVASSFACSLSESDRQPALVVFAHPATTGDCQAHVFVGGLAPDRRHVFAHCQLHARSERLPFGLPQGRRFMAKEGGFLKKLLGLSFVYNNSTRFLRFQKPTRISVPSALR